MSISIAVYGSSLFLTAVAGLLIQDGQYAPVFFAETTAVSTILSRNPALLLYQEGTPPADIRLLLAAGLVVVQITPHRNQAIVFRHRAPQTRIDVQHSTDFQTKLTRILVPHSL